MRGLAVVVLVGCGRLAFDPLGDATAITADIPADIMLIDPVGQLDPSFGNGGVLQPSSAVQSIGWDVAARGDGYLIVGVDYRTPAVMTAVALTESGALDPTWDGDGELFTIGTTGVSAYAYGLLSLPNGDSLMFGDGQYGPSDDFVLARVDASGALVSTFGPSGDGFAAFNIPPTTAGDTARRAVIVNDVIYVCGRADYSGDPRIGVIAVRADGSLEPGFQNGGIYSTNPTAAVDECRDMLFDGTRLVGAGRTGGNVAVFTLDVLGAGASTTVAGMSGTSRGIARHADGRIVLAGYDGSSGFLARYAANLSPDASLGTSGVVMLAGDVLGDVVIDSAGRYVAVGSRGGMGLVARYLADGTPDPSFGTGGRFVLPGMPGLFEAVLIDSRGRIVAVGSTNDVSGSHMLVLRVQ